MKGRRFLLYFSESPTVTPPLFQGHNSPAIAMGYEKEKLQNKFPFSIQPS